MRCARVGACTIGILGGTGPAGRGLAVRLAAAGDRGRHRLARRRAGGRGGRRGWSAPGPTARWRSAGRRTSGAAAADLVVVATPWDGAVATVAAAAPSRWRQGGRLDGQRPGQGGPRDPGPDPAPGLGGRRRSRPPCPSSLVSAAFHHLPASEMENLERGWRPTSWCARTTPRRPRPPSRWSTASRAARRSTPAAWPRPPPSRRSPPCCITLNIRHKAHAAVRLTGSRRRADGRSGDPPLRHGAPGGRRRSSPGRS